MANDGLSQNNHGALGTSAPAADGRRHLRNSKGDPEDDLPEDERLARLVERDITRIPHGFAQLSRAFLTVSRQDRDERDRKRKLNDAALSTELQRLAEWSARKVVIGGVEMTNGQAQDARRRFIDNEDEYAERAARRGDIRHDQKERLKHEVRRECELNDREGRGISTDADRIELEKLRRSNLAGPRDRLLAEIHTGRAPALASDADRADKSLFQTTPDLQGRFASAQAPQTAVQPSPSPAEVLPSPAALKKPMGLDL